MDGLGWLNLPPCTQLKRSQQNPMRMNSIQNLLLKTTLVTLTVVAPLAAQTKVAVVDFETALLETAEMKKAAAALEAKLAPRRDAIQTLQRELQELQQKLQTAGDADTISLQNDFQRKQRDGQRMSEDLQADYEFERNEILQRGAEKMREAVHTLAEQKGLDLVVDVGNALYFKPAMDLTKEAAAAYDQAYPVQ